MALKDWKKIIDDSELTAYRKGDETLNIFDSYFYTDKHLIEVSVTKFSKKIKKMLFKTQAHADKYANKYMKLH